MVVYNSYATDTNTIILCNMLDSDSIRRTLQPEQHLLFTLNFMHGCYVTMSLCNVLDSDRMPMCVYNMFKLLFITCKLIDQLYMCHWIL